MYRNSRTKCTIYQTINKGLILSNINNILDSSGYSRDEIYNKINISYEELTNLQKGNISNIGMGLIYKICDYFKLTPGEIIA